MLSGRPGWRWPQALRQNYDDCQLGLREEVLDGASCHHQDRTLGVVLQIVGGWKWVVVDSGWRVVGGKWVMGSGWWVVDGKWWVMDGE